MLVLHGCTQSADDVAAGTRMNQLADRFGFVVVYPEQRASNNRNKCWNWYDAANQVRGAGEPVVIAGIVEQVLGSEIGSRLDHNRVYVVGMSAGAAMAVVMGAVYPDLVAGVGAHSGLAYAAARSAPAALLSMRNGGLDPEARGRQAWIAMGDHATTMPVVIVQGEGDTTVRAVNGSQVAQQWLATNRLALSGTLALGRDRPDHVDHGRSPGGLSYETRTWDGPQGRPLVQYWSVAGLGHAWSGGSPAGSYTDAAGPDATSAIWAFLSQQSRAPAAGARPTSLDFVRRAWRRVGRRVAR
jgi:poly(hydroxyalkanoate) depolymerase family esterase